ncbi:MAG: cupin domain-containing protein [Acidothermus cellulolyticus]|nr:cupin domain-containing protein [Acidothermus cellulolyticus]MCL6550014.1 cupin domain-containing protein [Acidothermus cellulolyticus]
MNVTQVPQVGERLRRARLRRGVSLRSLARDLGVSASLLSQIETGKSQPSVSTLYAITTALGLAMEEVFEQPTRARRSVPPPMEMDLSPPARAAREERHERLGPVVTPEDRKVLHLDSGVTWEWLGRLPHSHVEFLLITYHPGGTSSSNGGLMRHHGAEYGYLISGELILTLGFEEYRLRPGDAVSFASTTPHRLRNEGQQPAVGVWFVTEEV